MEVESTIIFPEALRKAALKDRSLINESKRDPNTNEALSDVNSTISPEFDGLKSEFTTVFSGYRAEVMQRTVKLKQSTINHIYDRENKKEVLINHPDTIAISPAYEDLSNLVLNCFGSKLNTFALLQG